MRVTSSFIDICIISQRDRIKDPTTYLGKIEPIFTRMMPVDRRIFVDTMGRDHVLLECRRDQDFTAFIEKWSSFFEKLLIELPETLKNTLPKNQPQKNASALKKGVFLVLKIQTNLTRLVNYLLNFANGIYPLLGVHIFYESVEDGLIAYIQDESDFETFLRPLSNEKIVQEFYQKLGIKSKDFFTHREKILKTSM